MCRCDLENEHGEIDESRCHCEPVSCSSRYCETLVGFRDTITGDVSHEDGDSESREIDGKWYCSKCAESVEWYQWLEPILDQVAAIADEHEWEFDRNDFSGGFNTRSRYYTLTRECDNCVLGHEGCTCETLKLRISDHGSAHCTEDISLAMEPSGDDHTINDLTRRLSRARPA